MSIEDVDLNLFTRRIAIKKFQVAGRQAPEPFVAFDRLDVRIAYGSLLRFDIRLAEIRLDGLAVRVVRTGPAEFNFSDLIEKFSQPEPEKPPSRWTYTVERLDVTGASILVLDEHVAPRSEWRLGELAVQAAGITTAPDRPPGRVRVEARLNPETAVAIDAASVRLAPLAASAKISLTDFDLTRVGPYLPPGAPASPRSGKLGVSLAVEVEKAADAPVKLAASGDVRLDGVSVLQRDHTDPFLAVGRLGVAIKAADLVARAATVAVELEGLEVKAVRDKAGDIDLLGLAANRSEPPAGGAATADAAVSSPGPPFTLTLERIDLRSGSLALRDEAVAPPREWKIDGLTVEGGGLSTAAEAPPGKLAVRAQITSSPGPRKPASLTVESDSLRLIPLAASARLALSGFDVMSAMPYVPGTLPASPSKGTLGVDVTAQVERGEAGLTRAAASGTVRLDDAAVVERGEPAPFISLPKLVVAIRDADAIARAVTLGRIELEGLDLRAVRDAQDRINLLGLFAVKTEKGAVAVVAAGRAAPAPANAPPTRTPPPAGEWKLALDRFVLTKGTATFEDRAVSPNTSLVLGDLAITGERLSWPPTSKAAVTVSANMPGGGRTEVKGEGTLEPLNVQLWTETRDAPITPYQPYFPFVAQLFGLFSGDSVSEIQRAPDGALILASRGTARARELAVKGPDDEKAAIRTAEIEIRGIDFSWPNYALVDQVTITHPEVQIERDASGGINMRRLFEPRKAKADGPPARMPSEEKPAEKKGSDEKPPEKTGADQTPADKPGGSPRDMVIDFNEIRIDDGFLRFLDRTTKPAFSQDISKLAVSVRGLSNVLGRQRTTMSLQALVGGDAALDLRGETSGIGEAFHADLVGELRDFALAAANPYADALTSWLVQRGKLTTKVHYRIDGDQLIADHDVKFAGLDVQRARESDEAKQKLGVPLGLAVALLKDSRGDIDFDLQLKGTLSDKKFNWGEAMWAGIKQVLVKVLAAPFNAMGRMFTGGGGKVAELAINPVTFEPGSSVIAPSAELQITRVADFLRRAPYIAVDLSAVATEADAENIKRREVRARVQQFQKERGIADLPTALKAYYQEKAPGVTLPETVEAQLARLSEREPVAPAQLSELAARRLGGVKDRLVKTEGIPAERVISGKPAAASGKPADGEGRVEFAIAAE